jgi:hypothetical protein
MSNVTETPATHAQTAEEIINALRQVVRGSLPGYKLLAAARRRRINMSGHVHEDFLRQVAVMLDVNPALVAAVGLTGAEIREHLSFLAAYEKVGDELMLLGRGVKDTLVDAHAQVGQRALQAVAIARTITRPEDREKLMPHLDNIQKSFSRGKRKVRKPADEVPLVPVPTQSQTVK